MPRSVLLALAFNACMFLLPLASAAALIVISRDHLYAYEYSPSNARAIVSRVERLNGELIQLDFDRQRQWDDLVAMELNASDASAARGFLLSGRGMLPARITGVLQRAVAQDAGDAAIEMAALELLTPTTRARYQNMVPLLSRTPNAQAERTSGAAAPTLADPRDFELMASALLSEPETDPLQFTLTGLALGLAGDVAPNVVAGAAAVLAASRRDDYPHTFAADMQTLLGGAVSTEEFRGAALANAPRDAAGAYENLAAAFRAAADPEGAQRARATLAEIGDMSEATSPATAAMLLMHASSLQDVPRLRLIAQAAGDRAAAAAKRLPRDGRLLAAARGELTMNRDLVVSIAAVIVALAGLILTIALKLIQAGRDVWLRMQDDDGELVDDYGGELVDIRSSSWRPL